jgi:hypothetical protein
VIVRQPLNDRERLPSNLENKTVLPIPWNGAETHHKKRHNRVARFRNFFWTRLYISVKLV